MLKSKTKYDILLLIIEANESKNEALFNEADANSLASDRKLGEVKNAFYKLKEFIKSKNISKQKGEEKE